MKKLIYIVSAILLVCGCSIKDMDNTPKKQVEKFLNSYQTLDTDVLNDLDDIVNKEQNLTRKQKDEYRDILKRHYEKLDYKIKEETINGDKATVEAEIEVYDYTINMRKADENKLVNEEIFYDEEGNYSEELFQDYRLNLLKNTTDRVKYTIFVTLTKVDGKWQVDKLSNIDEEKILGIYVY